MHSSRRGWRFRQSLLTCALGVPLLVAIAAAPPFAAEPRAQGPSGMIGPSFPIMAGSDSIVPVRSGNTISYPTRWACGDSVSNRLTLSNPDGSGRYRSFSRQLGVLLQTVTITSFVDGAPRSFVITEEAGGTTIYTTSVSLVDLNADGVVDAATFSGQYNATISFVFSGDNISIPWSQASTLDIDTNYSCAGALPQVWAPLADTNGDGRGDAIVFDLDGNGVADGDMFAGPTMAVPAVPAMGPLGRLVLMLLVAAVGGWFLTRRQGSIDGTPA